MEKIQQAIERARQQRASLASPAAAATATAPRPSDHRPEPAAGPWLEQVSTVRLDPRHLSRHRIVAASADDPRADIFRSLRTQLLLRLKTLGGHSVAIVSARDGEGKTFVACNLALSLTRQAEVPVVLVDMDFRRPTVHSTLGLDVAVGFSDVIEGDATLEKAVRRVEGTQLHVLPQPRRHPLASELVASNRARDLLREIAQSVGHGYVVIDCPPLLLTDEPLVVQGHVDGCLLVVEQGRTGRHAVEQAAELLDETKYLGSVVNKGDAGDTGTYYGYR